MSSFDPNKKLDVIYECKHNFVQKVKNILGEESKVFVVFILWHAVNHKIHNLTRPHSSSATADGVLLLYRPILERFYASLGFIATFLHASMCALLVKCE